MIVSRIKAWMNTFPLHRYSTLTCAPFLFPKCIGFGVKTRSYAKPDFLPFPVHITCSAFPSAFRDIENGVARNLLCKISLLDSSLVNRCRNLL